ncbi:helix-turn-helix transcriptional regulator [Actinocrispum sp. NPDC049592]|uniref:helix-turn-helix transcriptional regulator n=1 Tax=Actinocrispum sp. NPDC049592 TaxID=3154835 RepID=UPI00341E5ED1
MAGGSGSRDLGDLLERLKVGSGRSYESIARRTNLSRSTVHRYCTGSSVPKEFGVLERIALVCGADRQDLVQLHRLWLCATTSDEPTSAPVVAEAEPVPPAPVPARSGRRLQVLGAVALAAILIMAAASGDSGSGVSPAPGQQRISGPAWLLPPAPVPSTLFGVTINSGSGAMPAFKVGAVRFWDSGTRWSEVQRQPGEFDWSALERQVSGAERLGVPPLFVFGGTPRWASPTGPAGPYPDGTAAPPDNLADWDLFVRTLVERYRGRIEAYELWVLANDRRFYAGSVENLVEMTRRASALIRSIDPKATVVCPGMGQLWGPRVSRSCSGSPSWAGTRTAMWPG